jgi:hypothetical protein
LARIDKIPVPEWPDVPYHHGMGRIREYEMWRNALPEKECMAEVAAARVRFTEYNRQRTIKLYDRMTELGFRLPWHVIPGFNAHAPRTSDGAEARGQPGGSMTTPVRNPLEKPGDPGSGPDV